MHKTIAREYESLLPYSVYLLPWLLQVGSGLDAVPDQS
jgi:hypothetical protein